MILKLSLAAAVAILLPNSGISQTTFSGPPTQDDYNYWCKHFGAKGEKQRDQCESEMRLRRGVGTCDDTTWTHSCQVDSMSDATHCTGQGSGSNLFVFAEKGRLSFGIIGETYPGENSKIRVDSNPAMSFDDDSGTTRAQDAAIEAQIRKGKIIKTRYSKWPSGIAVDSETPICDLTDVLDAMKRSSK